MGVLIAPGRTACWCGVLLVGSADVCNAQAGMTERLAAGQPLAAVSIPAAWLWGVLGGVGVCFVLLLWACLRWRRAAARLRARELQYKTLTAHVPGAAVVLFDRDLRQLLARGRLFDELGFAPDAVEGKLMKDVVQPSTFRKVEPAARAALAGETRRLEIDFQGRSYEVRVMPVALADGRVETGMITLEEVTRARATEAALRESEQRFQDVIDNMPVMLDAFDDQGLLVAWNRECERVTGYRAEEIIGNPKAFELLYPDPGYREEVLSISETSAADLRDIEQTLTCKNGEQRTISWYNISKQFPIPGWAGWAIGVDVTERRRAEEARREEQRRLELALVGADLGMWDWYPQTNRVSYHALWAAHLEYAPDEVGTHVEFFKEHVHPDDLKDLFARADEHLAGKAPMYESEHRLRTKTGRYKWVLDRGRVVDWDADGRPLRMTGVIQDITARKREAAELARHREHLEELVRQRTKDLEAAQEALLRRERLATLGQVIATVSHEIRNPLGTIRSSVFTIGKAVRGRDENLDRALGRVERAIARCDAIIEELLGYTRGQPVRSARVKLDGLVSEVLDELSLPPGVAVERTLEADCAMNVDRERLRRSLVNVLTNATQALSDDGRNGGRIAVETRRVADRVEVRIADDGPGIPAEIRERVFEPLYSTRSFGVGLGLTIVYDIMGQLGGGVRLESEPGQGTEVTLWLPLSETRRTEDETDD